MKCKICHKDPCTCEATMERVRNWTPREDVQFRIRKFIGELKESLPPNFFLVAMDDMATAALNELGAASDDTEAETKA